MKLADMKGAIDSLVDGGAVFTIHEMGITAVIGLLNIEGDTVKWCDWFPEDQHHFHKFEVYGARMLDTVNFELLTDRGLVSLNMFEPYEREYKENWPRWEKERGKYQQDLEREFNV